MQLDRRRFLGGGAAAALALGAGLPALARQGAAGPYPGARIEPVSETFFGQTVTDPYRWMENPDDPEWHDLLAANAAHARAAFDAIPGRAGMAARLQALSQSHEIAWAPEEHGERLVFRRQPADAETPRIYLREGGEERLVIDPETVAGGGPGFQLAWWALSPDGRHIVFGLTRDGTEDAVLQVMNVDSGELLPERIDRCGYASVSWLPDSSGFFYLRLADAEFGSMDYFIAAANWLHRLGDDPAEDQLILREGLDPRVELTTFHMPIVIAEVGSDWVLATTDSLNNVPIWKARLGDVVAGRANWEVVCLVSDRVSSAAFRGNELWLVGLTEEGGTRLMRADLRQATPLDVRFIMVEQDREIQFVVPTSDSVYVGLMDGGYSRLFRLGPGDRPKEVGLPYEGSIIGMTWTTRSPNLFLRLTSWLESPTVWRVDGGRDAEYAGLATPPDIDTSSLEVVRELVTARDGTRVPLSIIAPRGLVRDGSTAAMVEAYGAYQKSITPGFDAMGLALLEQGAIQVIAHVRGGGELGVGWWEAGRGITKPNTWRDLIDCCEHLVSAGWTSPDRLGITGASAGGIAVGRALTERPDLFALVVSEVGLLNPLRGEFEPSGPANIPEYGSVTTQEGFEGLLAMDSLHNVVDGTRYPPVILTHGVNDPRVAIWHSGKMAARLRAAGAPGSGPVLFRVSFDAGHGAATRVQAIEKRADVFACMLHHAGHPAFQRGSSQPQAEPR